MLSLVTSARVAFRAAMAAGAVTLTLTSATLGTAEPAQAFVYVGGGHVGGGHGGGGHGGGFHGGGFHGGGLGHLGGFRSGGFRHVGGDFRPGGFGRHLGGFRFAHRGVGFRRYGYGARRFAYERGIRFGGYGFRRCLGGFHFVPGIGCRRVGHYGNLGYRPIRHGVRLIRPHGVGHRHVAYGHGRHIGGFGFRHRGGLGHHGFGHHGGFRRH